MTKKKTIFTLLLLCCTIFLMVGCGSKKEPNKNTNNDNDEYAIITNVNSITQKTWNSPNIMNKSMSNKEFFDSQYSNRIGNRHGVLSIPNKKYETQIKYNGNFYKLTINPNEWFFMSKISSDLGNAEEIILYVLDTKFVMHQITISFENPINDNLKNDELYEIKTYNNWKILTDKNTPSDKWAYYELNNNDYIIIDFRSILLSNEKLENFYKEFFQNFYIETTQKEDLRVEFNKEDLLFNLTDNVSIDLSNVTIKSWFVDSSYNTNIVSLYYNNDTIQLLEDSNVSIEEEINTYNDGVAFTITEHIDYNGLKVHLMRLGSNFKEAGNLVGAIFEANNKVYRVTITTGSIEANSTEATNDAIDKLLSPILVIQ